MVQTSSALRNATDTRKMFKPTLGAAESYHGTSVVFVLRTAVTPENRKSLVFSCA